MLTCFFFVFYFFFKKPNINLGRYSSHKLRIMIFTQIKIQNDYEVEQEDTRGKLFRKLDIAILLGRMKHCTPVLTIGEGVADR